MSKLTLQLPDEIEQMLKARAQTQSRDVASVALELVEKGLREEASATQLHPVTHELWLREFDDWVNSHPKVDVILDVSRESMYEGRGE